MGLAASAKGGSGSGCFPRFTKTITSKASANATEAPARYGWKGLDDVDSDKAFNVTKAIQQMRETILMFTAIFIPCDPILCVQETKIYRVMVDWTECPRHDWLKQSASGRGCWPMPDEEICSRR